jgi:hypothetical protein
MGILTLVTGDVGARRQRCLAFVDSGGRPSVRGEGRGKREICLRVSRVRSGSNTKK